MRLILLRHGESTWNLENKFTGWTDVDLTENGIYEASMAGKQLLKENIKLGTIHTSLLMRAIHTTKIVSKLLNFDEKKIQYNWRLNERHYGALQGLNKSEAAEKYGEERVKVWRRSFDTSPPHLTYDDKRHPRFDKNYINAKYNLPIGESLKDVIDRLNPFWNNFLKRMQENSLNDHLIVAHSNSLRALIMMIEKLSKDEIISVNIPTGIPLIYNFDSELKFVNKSYLIDNKELKKKQLLIEQQGRIK